MRFFSARQIVTMVVAVSAAAVLTPTAVSAAGATLVKLTDGSGKVAQINRSGHLLVSDGKGRMSVDGKVKVNGNVTSALGAPRQPWNTVNGVTLSAAQPSRTVYSGQVGHRLNLTSFAAAAEGGTGGTVALNVNVYVNSDPGGSCSPLTGDFGAAERFHIVVPVGQTVVLTYPSPLVYTQYGVSGRLFCVNASASGPSGYLLNISASGFIT